jgi:hypothetical protein
MATTTSASPKPLDELIEVAGRLAIARHVVLADEAITGELVDHVLVVVGNYDFHERRLSSAGVVTLVDWFHETDQIGRDVISVQVPHPEEPCEARRLEGWILARSLRDACNSALLRTRSTKSI